MRQAIDKLVATGPTRQRLVGMSRGELADELIRCTRFDDASYCLNVGFTSEATGSKAFENRTRRMAAEGGSKTGDMSLGQRLEMLAALPTAERRAVEEAELESAAEAADEIVAMNEVRDGNLSASAVQRLARRAPANRLLFADSGARRQVKSYYCGPATLQMIDGNDPGDGTFDTQASWAADLGTEAAGATWIGDMVAQVNAKTAWDNTAAGNFVVQSISNWDKEDYWITVKLMIGDWGTPYIEHPRLHSDYYAYLSTSGGYGGHFQMGRGYKTAADGTRYVHIFEPYNEPDWTGYTATTWGARRATLANVIAANKANQANIGI